MDLQAFFCGSLWDTEILELAKVSVQKQSEKNNQEFHLSMVRAPVSPPFFLSRGRRPSVTSRVHAAETCRKWMELRDCRLCAPGSEGGPSVITDVNVSLWVADYADANQLLALLVSEAVSTPPQESPWCTLTRRCFCVVRMYKCRLGEIGVKPPVSHVRNEPGATLSHLYMEQCSWNCSLVRILSDLCGPSSWFLPSQKGTDWSGRSSTSWKWFVILCQSGSKTVLLSQPRNSAALRARPSE